MEDPRNAIEKFIDTLDELIIPSFIALKQQAIPSAMSPGRSDRNTYLVVRSGSLPDSSRPALPKIMISFATASK